MQFIPGQTVIHPHHGPAQVVDTPSRTIGGKEVHYLRLRVEAKDLDLGIPLAAAEELGVRPPMDTRQVERLFTELLKKSGKVEKQWSRRIKADVERFHSGNMLTVAGLVRDMTRREEDQGLSLGERDLLRDARALLLDELSIVLGLDEEGTVELLRAAILDGLKPDLSAVQAPVSPAA